MNTQAKVETATEKLERLRAIVVADSDLSAFIDGYIECALWSESAEMNDDGECVDADREMVNDDRSFSDHGFDSEDLSSEAEADILGDCIDFWDANKRLMRKLDAGQCGHNFMLSRNGHGTGFWDRGWGAIGDKLHSAAKTYGTQGLIWNGESIDTHS